jgi:hypothetical protein
MVVGASKAVPKARFGRQNGRQPEGSQVPRRVPLALFAKFKYLQGFSSKAATFSLYKGIGILWRAMHD